LEILFFDEAIVNVVTRRGVTPSNPLPYQEKAIFTELSDSIPKYQRAWHQLKMLRKKKVRIRVKQSIPIYM
jgi:hypothetical protein